MSENKFIKHLKGKNTAKSVLEIKNQNTPTSFGNMPVGSSNANDVYSDHRGDATGVLKGTENWKLDGTTLTEATTVYGDGRDMGTTYDVSGTTLWVDATATFSASKRYSPHTKFVLKLCGNNLLSDTAKTVDFTLLVTIGSTTVTKSFTVATQALFFCKEFVIDFAESNASAIKAAANGAMSVQLLCGDANASATIYNGMSVFTVLRRRVDSEAVSSDTRTLDEFEEDFDDLCDEFDQFVITMQEALDGKVSKTGDTMSGALEIAENTSSNNVLLTLANSTTTSRKWNFRPAYNTTSLSLYPGSTETNGYRFVSTGFCPASDNARYLGAASLRWKATYTCALNNGGDLVVPNKSGTLATTEDVDQAANSGRMITDQGVWYAKMDRHTTPPAYAEVGGRNYADFTQDDGHGNPLIVIYTYTQGAWKLTETITPPANYDGYVPITSKIWDIPEQSGQQGGRVLWNHQSRRFTPYPFIVSTDNMNITNSTITTSSFSGVATLSSSSTVTVSNPTLTSIANYGLIIDRQNAQNIADVTWAATLTIILSDDKTIYCVDATTDTDITIDASGVSVGAGDAKTFEIHIACGATLPVITWTGIDNWLIDCETTPIEANATSIFALRVQQRPSEVAPRVVANYGGAY